MQRGRGQGYLDALESDRGEVARALNACLTTDPRTDHQVENRDEYRARLGFEIKLDLAPLRVFLLERGSADADNDWRDPLALYTLGWLARLGRRDAVDILRRYVAVGRDWPIAIEALSSPTALDVSGLDVVASQRCPSIEELARALPYTDEFPWNAWRESNERIREAFPLQERERDEYARRRGELERLSTAELLRRREVSVLRGRSSDNDRAVLLAAAMGDDPQQRHDAIKELGWQGDPRVLDAAEAELRRFPDREWPPNAGAIAIHHLARRSPIPRVRQWIGEPGQLGKVARSVIASWPEPGDEPLLRSMASAFGDWLYGACDAVDGLVSLGDADAVPVFEQIFRETTYSYLRRRTARALSILSTSFAMDFAVECLWDCEGSTVAIGCASATLTSPAVRERLNELAADRFTAPEIQSLAAKRMAPVDPPEAGRRARSHGAESHRS